MDYDEFKAFLVTYLWKDGDQVLIDNLDRLIEMGHASLRVDLRLRDQLELRTESLTTDTTALSPFHYVRNLSSETDGEFKWVEPTQLTELRAAFPNKVTPVYSIFNNLIQLSGPFADLQAAGEPYSVSISGYTDIPDFAQVGIETSFMADNYLDLYVYAVLQHAAGFLREDERVAQWKQLYNEGVQRVTNNDMMFGQRGKPRSMALPYPASPTRNRNWRHNL